MANEFKIKKGLIVTGASGGTVVDIQGSQGQLFSVTDDLSGSIFAVSDISGVPILDINSSGLSTFDGDVNLPDSKKILLGTGDDLQIFHNGTNSYIETSSVSAGDFYIKALGTNHDLYLQATDNVYIRPQNGENGIIVIGDGAVQLYYNNSQKFVTTSTGVTVTGSLKTTATGGGTGVLMHTNSGISINSNLMQFWTGQTSGYSFYANATGDGTNELFALNASGNGTFAAQAFATTATSSGDASSTLTTKGYVDGLITGATIYRGAWDPSGGGYGSPDLSGVTQTSGYYYICSADGTAEPNGTGTEPDTWAVGDWVIYNDVSGTGQWQKIDNSSVLSGVGTGQTVALWEGAGSVTDSETLGNAPITVSGDDTAFAGNITAYTGGGTGSLGVGRTSNQSIKLYITDTNNSITAEQDSDGNSAHKFILNRVFDGTGANDFKIQKGGTDQFTLDTSANATFAGTIYASGNNSADWSTAYQEARQWDGGNTNLTASTGRVSLGATTIGNNMFTLANPGAITFPRFNADNTISPLAAAPFRNAIGAAAYTALANYLPLAGGTMTGNIDFNDSVRARFGDGDDLQIVHDGSNSYIHNVDVGDLYIRQTADNKSIILQSDNGSGGTATYLTLNGNSTDAYFSNPGNVGIGTTGPTALLEVKKDNATIYDATSDSGQDDNTATVLVSNDNATTNTFSQIAFHNKASGRGISRIVSIGVASASTDLAFVTENSNTKAEKMRILANGNVGIGTPIPTQAKLVVNGNVAFNQGDETMGQINPEFERLDFKVSDGVVSATPVAMTLRDYANGPRLGIGTTTPSGKLDIQGTQGQLFSVTDDLSGSIFAVADISGVPIFDVNSSGVSYFDGNVGIGTTSPSAKLDIVGNGANYALEVNNSSTGDGIKINTEENQVNNGMLWYQGSKQMFNLHSDSSNNAKMILRANGAYKIYLNSSGISYINGGNVGIGVTTTSYKLEVDGGSKISGNVIIGTDPNTYANLSLKDATTTGSSSKSLHIISQNSGRSFLSLVTAGTGEAQIGFGTSQYASQNTSGSIQYTQATSKFTFKTNYTLALTIANNQAATFTSTVTATNFILSSDKTLKNNIKEIDTSHIDVNWKNFELKSEPGVKRAGVIAQELEEKHPEFVRTNDQGMKSVAYIDLLIAKIAELEARLEKAGI